MNNQLLTELLSTYLYSVKVQVLTLAESNGIFYRTPFDTTSLSTDTLWRWRVHRRSQAKALSGV